MAAVLGACWIGYLTSIGRSRMSATMIRSCWPTRSLFSVLSAVQWRHEISLQRAGSCPAGMSRCRHKTRRDGSHSYRCRPAVENRRDFFGSCRRCGWPADVLRGLSLRRGSFVAKFHDIDRRTSSSWRLAGFVGLSSSCTAGVFAPAAVLIYNQAER